MQLDKIIYKKDNLDLSPKTFKREAAQGVIERHPFGHCGN